MMIDPLREIFRDPPILETSRLQLRKMLRSDAADMFEYAKDPAITRFLTWDPHPDQHYTRRYLAYVAGKYKTGEFFDWALILKDTEKMIGTCGFTRLDNKNRCGEIGYVLNRDYWGQGLAAEALARVIQFSFDVLNLIRVESRYMEENISSRRVMEKAGMTYEGMLRTSLFVKGRFVSVGICSMTAEEFSSKKKERLSNAPLSKDIQI